MNSKKRIKTKLKQCEPVWGECGKESGHKGAHGEGMFTKRKKP